MNRSSALIDDHIKTGFKVFNDSSDLDFQIKQYKPPNQRDFFLISDCSMKESDKSGT